MNGILNKKTVIGLLLMFLLIFSVFLLGGFLFAKSTFGVMADSKPYEFVLLGFLMVIFTFLGFAIYFLGRYLYGKLTGYELVAFRLGGRMLARVGDNIFITKACELYKPVELLMVPIEAREGRFPTSLYILGGTIASLFFAGIFAILFVLLSGVKILSALLIYAVTVESLVAIVTGIPLSFAGFNNDGAKALALSKSENARNAFRWRLMIFAALSQGVRLSEMPDEWFSLPELKDEGDAFCTSLIPLAVRRLLYGDRLLEVVEISEKYVGLEYFYHKKRSPSPFGEASTVYSRLIVNNALSVRERVLVLSDLIFAKLVCERGKFDLFAYITDEMAKPSGEKTKDIAFCRTVFALVALKLKNAKMAENTEQKFYSLTNAYPYTSICEAEGMLLLSVKNVCDSFSEGDR